MVVLDFLGQQARSLSSLHLSGRSLRYLAPKALCHLLKLDWPFPFVRILVFHFPNSHHVHNGTREISARQAEFATGWPLLTSDFSIDDEPLMLNSGHIL
jgi:hypothetical protein